MSKTWRVKIREIHTGYVVIDAETAEEALEYANDMDPAIIRSTRYDETLDSTLDDVERE